MNTSTARHALHTRAISVTGYERDDGLFEVEGWLTDTKPFDFHPPSGDRTIAAGAPIHRMGVRIAHDEEMNVLEVQAIGEALPYGACAGGPATLQVLVGLNMGRGWASETRKRLAGTAGCVHFTSLLGPMAATAFQSMVKWRLAQAEKDGGFQPALDTCVAYARDGELVRTRYPVHYLAKPTEGVEPRP